MPGERRERLLPPPTPSGAKLTNTHIVTVTDCFDCGAAAVHATGVNGMRAAQAWIESHHIICKAKETK